MKFSMEKETHDTFPVEGVLTFTKKEGKWLAQGDRFDNAAFSGLINP